MRSAAGVLGWSCRLAIVAALLACWIFGQLWVSRRIIVCLCVAAFFFALVLACWNTSRVWREMLGGARRLYCLVLLQMVRPLL